MLKYETVLYFLLHKTDRFYLVTEYIIFVDSNPFLTHFEQINVEAKGR